MSAAATACFHACASPDTGIGTFLVNSWVTLGMHKVDAGRTGYAHSGRGPYWVCSQWTQAILGMLTVDAGRTGYAHSGRGPHWVCSQWTRASLDMLTVDAGLTGYAHSGRGPHSVCSQWTRAAGVSNSNILLILTTSYNQINIQ